MDSSVHLYRRRVGGNPKHACMLEAFMIKIRKYVLLTLRNNQLMPHSIKGLMLEEKMGV